MGDPRSFITILGQIDRGRLNQNLSEALQELVAACAAFGKKGTLTLTLTVDPNNAEDSEHCGVASEVRIKKPGPSHRKEFFFIDEDKNLSRRDPRQGDLEDITGPRAADGQT